MNKDDLFIIGGIGALIGIVYLGTKKPVQNYTIPVETQVKIHKYEQYEREGKNTPEVEKLGESVKSLEEKSKALDWYIEPLNVQAKEQDKANMEDFLSRHPELVTIDTDGEEMSQEKSPTEYYNDRRIMM